MTYQMLKFFKRIAYFISRDDPKTFILLYKIQKIQVNKYLTF